MADPITITTAVITTACALIGAVKSIQEIRAYSRLRKAGRPWAGEPLEQEMPPGPFKLSRLFNRLVASFGSRFGDEVDEQMKREVLQIRPELKQLLAEMKVLESKTKRTGMDGKRDSQMEAKEDLLLKRANSLIERVESTLKNFNDRTGKPLEKEALESSQQQARPSGFCPGAVLCQHGKVSAKAISAGGKIAGARSRWGFICKYCSLEVGDYRALRLSRDGEALESSNLLAACHIIACKSFEDRKAFYKCLACYLNHKEVAFPSAMAFEKHMGKHPGFTFIKNEKEAAQTLKKEIHTFLDDESIPTPVEPERRETKKASSPARKPGAGSLPSRGGTACWREDPDEDLEELKGPAIHEISPMSTPTFGPADSLVGSERDRLADLKLNPEFNSSGTTLATTIVPELPAINPPSLHELPVPLIGGASSQIPSGATTPRYAGPHLQAAELAAPMPRGMHSTDMHSRSAPPIMSSPGGVQAEEHQSPSSLSKAASKASMQMQQQQPPPADHEPVSSYYEAMGDGIAPGFYGPAQAAWINETQVQPQQMAQRQSRTAQASYQPQHHLASSAQTQAQTQYRHQAKNTSAMGADVGTEDKYEERHSDSSLKRVSRKEGKLSKVTGGWGRKS